MSTVMQVHGIGGAAGVLWYALMAKKELVTELYGERPFASSCKYVVFRVGLRVARLSLQWLCVKHLAQSGFLTLAFQSLPDRYVHPCSLTEA